jgi:hypothetical protein
VTAFVGAAAAVLVAPGLRGLAKDHVVEISNHAAATLSYFLLALLVSCVVVAVLELSRNVRARNAWNGFGVAAAGLAVAIALPAIVRPLPAIMSVGLAIVTSTVVFAGGVQGLRATHTRAVGAMMLCLAVSGLLRVVAWNLARSAGDSGNTALYGIGRGVATGGLALEGLGQAVAAAWLGTRSRFLGQVLSSTAIGLAWVLTVSASHGASVSATPWQVAAHIALATASGLPQPFGPGGLAVFLLAASILLAGVAAVQREQVVAVLLALTLSLIARGALDVPMHALAATAGSLWLMLAVGDERAMWQALMATKSARGTRPSTPAPLETSGS